jgi:hypothetical protein
MKDVLLVANGRVPIEARKPLAHLRLVDRPSEGPVASGLRPVEADEVELPNGARWTALEAAILQVDEPTAAALAHAGGLHRWWTQTRFAAGAATSW